MGQGATGACMTPLMRYHLGTLRLRQDAPFPSQIVSAHELIRRWRHEQRLRIVRHDSRDSHILGASDPDSGVLDSDVVDES